MSYLKKLTYPKKSHPKEFKIPKYSQDLAEFFGIMMGDGGINSDWQFTITLNAISDRDYCEKVICLSNKLFGVKPTVSQRRNSNTLVLKFSSVYLVRYLIKLGLPNGNKMRNGLNIPEWIILNKKFKKACVRGLIDTDGCIFIHRHSIKGKIYKNLGLSFRSYDPKLIIQVADIFREFDIMPHVSKRGTDLSLYKEGSVIKFLNTFGTSNERIYSKYDEWRDARVV